MNYNTFLHAVLGTTLMAATLTACGDDKADEGGETTDSTAAATDPGSTVPTTSGTDPGTDSDPGTSGGDAGYVFAQDPYTAYTQIDRHAAVEAGTAGIAAAQGLGFAMGSDISIRDAYNASNPVEDAAGMWVPEISKSVTFFHDALDDDLIALMLVPATIEETVAQAARSSCRTRSSTTRPCRPGTRTAASSRTRSSTSRSPPCCSSSGPTSR